MSAGAVTPWFPPEVKPARKGDYQIIPPSIEEIRWSHWNGTMWSYFTFNHESLEGHRGKGLHEPRMQWRGLASKPA